jgi:hypothetical protein
MIAARLSSLLPRFCVSSLSIGSSKPPADSIEAGLGGFLEGVLPDADDFPSLLAKLAVDASVAGYVVLSFFIPKLPVGLRAGVALGTAVPEAPVDEDGDLLLREPKAQP